MLVKSAKHIKDYIIDVTFKDGSVKRYDFKKWLFTDINPMLYRFRKPNLFKQVHVENGIIVWGDDEMDFTPDHMIEMEVKTEIPDSHFAQLIDKGMKTKNVSLSNLRAKLR